MDGKIWRVGILAALFTLVVLCGTRAEEAKEPPPHYHDNSAIPSDELGSPPDAGPAPDAAVVADECPMSEPPPPPAMPSKSIRSGPPVTNYIPPELIMRPIRKRAACFRGCYQAGLARNAKLAGRISIRFVVEVDGWVRRARIVENELGDADVGECVRRSFVGLLYPSPEGGEVTVVYPLRFAPP